MNTENIEKESGYFIDTLNQQDHLFAALRDFGRKGKGNRLLEIISRSFVNTPIARCNHLMKYNEKIAENQMRFLEQHKNFSEVVAEKEN